MQHTVDIIKPFCKRIPPDDLWDRLDTDTRSGLNSPFNIDANVAIYLDNQQIYVHFLGVRYAVYKTKVEVGTLIENYYQDQGDQPEDIPDEEWGKREKLAERILDKHYSGTPSHCGFIWTMTDHTDCMWIAHQVQKSLHVVGYLQGSPGRNDIICVDCCPVPPEQAPKVMESDAERMEDYICVKCGRTFSYGNWRKAREK